MFSVKPLRVLSPPNKIFAPNNRKAVVQDSLMKSLEKGKKMRFLVRSQSNLTHIIPTLQVTYGSVINIDDI